MRGRSGRRGVVLAGRSVDLYNSRPCAPAPERLPPPDRDRGGAADAVRAAQAAGYAVLATAADGEVDLFEADEVLARPTAWLLGGGPTGSASELAELADHRVRIPIHGRAEPQPLHRGCALPLRLGPGPARSRLSGDARGPHRSW